MFFLTRATMCIGTVAALALWDGDSRSSLPELAGGIAAAGLGQARELCAGSRLCGNLERGAAKAVAAIAPAQIAPAQIVPDRTPAAKVASSREGRPSPRSAALGRASARQHPPALTGPPSRG